MNLKNSKKYINVSNKIKFQENVKKIKKSEKIPPSSELSARLCIHI